MTLVGWSPENTDKFKMGTYMNVPVYDSEDIEIINEAIDELREKEETPKKRGRKKKEGKKNDVTV